MCAAAASLNQGRKENLLQTPPAYLIRARHIHLISKTLKEVESLLQGHGFLRVHQSHLVNLNHIKQYVKSDGGYLVMTDNSNITVSRAKKEELYRLFS